MTTGVPGDRGEGQYLTGATVVVDAANVVGSRPDGWWRDRAGMASRLLTALLGLPGTDVELPGVGPGRLDDVVVVLEGRARDAAPPAGPASLRVVRAAGSGDDEIVAQALSAADRGAGTVVVVSADRGLRARLPDGVVAVGPSWLRSLLDGSPGG